MKSCGMYPLPEMEKFLTSFLSSGSKDVECTPLELASGGNLGKSTFPCTVQWCMQICHNPFLITWGPFENVNLLYFLLKIQIWNGCNVVNIAGNPIKDINVNLSFLSSRWKVVECTPLPEMEKFLTSFLSSGSKVVECTPLELASGGNLGKSTFPCTVQWCMQICHNPFLITWGPFENVNLLYFLLKIQIWNGCNVVNIAGNPIKDINVNLSFLSSRWKVVECTPLPEMEKFLTSFLSSGSKVVEYTPWSWHLVEIWENLLFHVSMIDSRMPLPYLGGRKNLGMKDILPLRVTI